MDFDAVIESHQRYLKSLTSTALLDEASKPLPTRLNAILLAILHFYHLVVHTHSLLEAEQRRRQDLRQKVTRDLGKGTLSIFLHPG